MSCNKKGISSYELSRQLSLRQKTCWFFQRKVQEAMRSSGTNLLDLTKRNGTNKMHISKNIIGQQTTKRVFNKSAEVYGCCRIHNQKRIIQINN
jgi:hypothetical protein